jgi:hypothetical protein
MNLTREDYKQMGNIGRSAWEAARASSKYDPPVADEVLREVLRIVGNSEAWAVGVLYEMATSTTSGVIEEIPSQRQWIPISALSMLARSMARKMDVERNRSRSEIVRWAINDIATAIREEHAESGGRTSTAVHQLFMAFDMPALDDARRIILDAIGMDQDRYDEIMLHIFDAQRRAEEIADLKREKLESEARSDMEDDAG